MPPLCCTLNVDDTLLEVETLRQLLAICLAGINPDKEHLMQIKQQYKKIMSDVVANMIENLFINVHIAYPMTQLVQL